MIDKFLDKKVDRKEFLLSVGLLLFTLSGLPAVISQLKNISSKQEKPSLNPKSNGYGSSPYGI